MDFFIKRKPGDTVYARSKYLVAFLLIVALVLSAAFAIGGTYASEEDYAPEPEDVIHIDVDLDGTISVTPAEMEFDNETAENGDLIVTLPLVLEAEDIVVTLPEGWLYAVLPYEPDEGEVYESETYEIEAYSESGDTFIVITPRSNDTDEHAPTESDYIESAYEDEGDYIEDREADVAITQLSEVVFEFYKHNHEGDLLEGVVFHLYRYTAGTGWGTAIQIVTTDDTNAVEFVLTPDGFYRLREHSAPLPFQTPTGYWTLRVNAAGEIVIGNWGGVPAFTMIGNDRILENHPYPDAVFRFRKTDNPENAPGGRPLPDAEFILYHWCDIADDWLPHPDDIRAVSDADGWVVLDLPAPEWHQEGVQFKLREIAPNHFITPDSYWIVAPTFCYARQVVEFVIVRGPNASVDDPDMPPFVYVPHAGVGGTVAAERDIPEEVAAQEEPLEAQRLSSAAVPASIHIEIDDCGNIDMVPQIEDYGVTLDDRGYLHIHLPLRIDAANVSLAMPAGWTHTVTHTEECAEGFALPATNTVISVAHTWNDAPEARGYMGIAPFVTGAPYPVHTVPANAPLAQWNTAIGTAAAGGNRVVAVAGDHPNMPSVSIAGDRHIIVTSVGTDLDETSAGYGTGPDRHTLSRSAGTGRHFVMSGAASNNTRLTLVNIVLCGLNAAGARPAGTRGGVGFDAAGAQFIMQKNAVIQYNESPSAGVNISGGATMIMYGGMIRQNHNPNTGGTTFPGTGGVQVFAAAGAPTTSFIMHGGTISHNFSPTNGSGVGVSGSNASFTMYGGEITHNRAGVNRAGNTPANALGNGGGVMGMVGATITMRGGLIAYNTAHGATGTNNSQGGGVFLTGAGTSFYMEDGEIRDNFANTTGGGIHMQTGTITIEGGAIANNTAHGNGGGVFVRTAASSAFTMTGGTITNNSAVGNGGGIFTVNYLYADPLTPGVGIYDNLNISDNAVFSGNRARSRHNPPEVLPPGLQLPSELLNNDDINFAIPQGTWYLGNRLKPFVFYKTEEDRLTRLDGAIFQLFRREACEENHICADEGCAGFVWADAGSPVTSGACGDAGRVELILTANGRYRLRETFAPTGFVTPPGDWYIHWNGSQFVITHVPQNPAFIWVCDDCREFQCDAACEEENYVRHLPNLPETSFGFTKTDDADHPAAGVPLGAGEAEFRLYHRPDGVNWVPVPCSIHPSGFLTAASDSNGLVYFENLPEWASLTAPQFKLREIYVSNDFLLPPGHWEITVAFNFTTQLIEFDINRVLYSTEDPGVPQTPVFVPAHGTSEDAFFLGNRFGVVPFEFVKHNHEGDPLGGVVFHLYRWDPELGASGDWDLLETETTNAGTPYYGAVGPWMLTRDGLYRLVEDSAPLPFQTPPGYWLLQVNILGEIVITNWGGNPPFERCDVTGELTLANRPYPEVMFSFLKTDDADDAPEGDPLDDVVFYLYIWCDNADDWLTVDCPDNPGDQASAVSGAGGTAGLVEIALPAPEWHQAGTRFKLREVAPDRFITPLGYWIVTPRFNHAFQETDFHVERVLPSAGDTTTPDFVYVPYDGITIMTAELDLPYVAAEESEEREAYLEEYEVFEEQEAHIAEQEMQAEQAAFVAEPLSAIQAQPLSSIETLESVQITIDSDLNISTSPDVTSGVTFYDTGYIGIRIPAMVHAAGVSVTLPAHWNHWPHTVTHEQVEVPIHSETDGEAGPAATRTETHTVIMIAHSLFGEAAQVGIAPFVTGVPGGFTGYDILVTSHTLLLSAIGGAGDGNRVVNVAADFDMTGNVNISGNRHVIIASQGTNLDENDPDYGTSALPTRTIGRRTGAGRHFTIAANTTVTLVNIVLCGANADGTPPTIVRGGIIVNGANANLVMQAGSVIANNRGPTTPEQGGGVSVINGTFTMFDGTIRNNRGDGGGGSGGVHVSGANSYFTMWGGEIVHNESGFSGGAIASRLGGTTVMHDGLLAYNRSLHSQIASGGGAVFVGHLGIPPENRPASFTMFGGTVRNNTSFTSGGGFRIRDGGILTIHDGAYIRNNATGWRGGGGVFLEAFVGEVPVRFIMYGGTISENRASNITRLGGANPDHQPHGGGVQMYGGYFILRGDDPKYITGNHSSRNGGGINWIVGMMDTTDNTGPLHITENAARLHGGGMFIEGSGFVIDDTVRINANTAGQNGGGLHLSGGNLTMAGGQINHNGTIRGVLQENGVDFVGSLTQNGGGAFISGGNFNMTGGEIRNNTVIQDGGGIFLSGGTLSMTDSGTVTGNRAGRHGGGVALESAATNLILSGSDSTIRDNIAENSGGGVFVTSGTVTMTDGGVLNNTAHGNGGGVYLQAGTMHMNGGRISENRAAGPIGGGGVFVRTPTVNAFTMEAGSITNNSASRDGGGIFTMNHLYANPLTPGPGVYTNLNIHTGTIFYGNRARAWFRPPAIPAGTPVDRLENIVWNGVESSIYFYGYLYLLNNYDINFVTNPPGDWYLGNRLRTIPFYFHKTNHLLYSQVSQGINTDWNEVNDFLLAGAAFSLFRFNGPGSPPDPYELITDAVIGDGPGQWTRIWYGTSSGNPGEPMTLPLCQEHRYYQLVETRPPPACHVNAPNGFDLPWGQWRLTLCDNAALRAASDRDWDHLLVGFYVNIHWVGDPSVPAFARNEDSCSCDDTCDCDCDDGEPCDEDCDCTRGHFFVGNRPTLVLPMSGGVGRGPFTLAGFSLLLLALGTMTVQVRRGKLAFAEVECAGSCADCAYGTKLGATKVFCLRRGVMPIDGGCGRFTHHLRE